MGIIIFLIILVIIIIASIKSILESIGVAVDPDIMKTIIIGLLFLVAVAIVVIFVVCQIKGRFHRFRIRQENNAKQTLSLIKEKAIEYMKKNNTTDVSKVNAYIERYIGSGLKLIKKYLHTDPQIIVEDVCKEERRKWIEAAKQKITDLSERAACKNNTKDSEKIFNEIAINITKEINLLFPDFTEAGQKSKTCSLISKTLPYDLVYYQLKNFSQESGGFTFDEAKYFCQRIGNDCNYSTLQENISLLEQNKVVSKIPMGANSFLYKSPKMKSRTIEL